MRKAWSCLALCLAAGPVFPQVEVPSGETQVSIEGQAVAPGAPTTAPDQPTAAGGPTPALAPTIKIPLSPTPTFGDPVVSAAPIDLSLPARASAAGSAPAPDDKTPAARPAPTARADATIDPAESDPALAAAGTVRFDQGRAQPSFVEPVAIGAVATWSKFTSWLARHESVPPFPGRTAAAVRLGGKTYTLTRRIADSGISPIWLARPKRGLDVAVEFIHPALNAEEATALRDLAGTDVPHARLIAADRDGMVLVKELVEGPTLGAMLREGPLAARHRQALADLASRLLRLGHTADLSPRNLIWDKWGSRWTLVNGVGFLPAGPATVLGPFLRPELLSDAGLEAADLLQGVRARLGPDSKPWEAARAAAATSPALASGFEVLDERLASKAAGPTLRFERSGADAAVDGLDDSIVTLAEARRRLGYDPRRTGILLHGDDPGKLNTVVQLVEAPGRLAHVTKRASAKIIESELFLRKVIHRFFGAYFDSPRAIAVLHGPDSMIIMEHSKGSRDYVGDKLGLDDRVALALLVHTFGVGDVNPGNILYHGGDKPVLIDFEQAFSRHAPIPDRLPDERILLEMPWMSRWARNDLEDFLPGIRGWRKLFLREDTQAWLRRTLIGHGLAEAQAERTLRVFSANLADLEWTIQADVDFANSFVDRRSR